VSKYIIGVDGGGTKTSAAIADLEGNVLTTRTAPSSNYHLVGLEKTEQVFQTLIEQLLLTQAASREDLAAVCFGLSGVGRPDDMARMEAIMVKLGILQKTVIVNDAVIALMGGALTDHGVIVISGTGSIIFGMDKQGSVDRVGGWGHVLDDEGSGYKIGSDGLRLIMRAHDGRHQPTKVTQLVLRALNLEKPESLVVWSAQEGVKKPVVAGLAAHVFEAYRLGDPGAEEIVKHHSAELALGVEIVVKRMQLPATTNVVLCGGVFSANPEYFMLTRTRILASAEIADVIGPKMPPVVGALLCAFRRKIGVEITRGMLHNMRETFFSVSNEGSSSD